MTIAIVSSSFSQPSETFVREHVRSIAPDDTVLISKNEISSADEGYCILSGIGKRTSQGFIDKYLSRFLNSRWSPIETSPLTVRENIRVQSFLRDHRVSRVLAEFGPNGYLVLEACKQAALPLYVHFHGFDATNLPRYRSWRLRYKRLFDYASGIIVPSAFLAEKLISYDCPRDKLHICPNGVDAKRFNTSSRNKRQILAVGRMVPVKGPLITIKAFRQVLDRFPDSTLNMIGDGPLLDKCKDLADSLGLGKSIKLHGAQPNEIVAQFMSEAALFVQHSVEQPDGQVESFGVSILEAAAAGIPVVATRSGGIPEVVVHGTTGLLVAEHDIDGMANAMLELLTNPVLAYSMGHAGRDRVLANFTNLHNAKCIREVMML